jgi:uncharacterized protein
MTATAIQIIAGKITLQASLNDSPTARAIARKLPIIGIGQRWGDEIYFDIPVQMALEPDAREVVQAGELAYWPTGNAFCIFFGPTPASQGDEIRAASAVNIVGCIEGDPSVLRNVRTGTKVRLEFVG